MTTKHIGIVWNPSKTSREDLEGALVKAPSWSEGITVSWHETREDDPGRAAAQEALDAGADVVAAAGGDGTVRAVAEHLADAVADEGGPESGGSSDGPVAELAVIPLGTGNLLARNIDVPLNDLPGAFERALAGSARAIDVGWAEATLDGRVERKAFAVMAGFGIDAHMITETDEDLKSKAGWLAYVESLGRAVAASEVIDLRVSFDGGDAEEEKAHTFIIGNCGTLQGGITLLPDADPADGRLDLLVLNADGIVGWMDTLRTMVWDNGLKRLLTGGDRAESSDSTIHRRLTSLVVELDEPRVFEVDGDDLGEATRIEITVQPGAVRIR
ncbi:diacylglycerol kinase family enzyme [Microbacterium resistens]|uniref:Diacylglycerol kinase family enzyme n=1 Tax=Microbacterium resistens TaxID=156977 RepID=A0ABU1SAA9_9MICO|nr:diacylglycerol kinase family protein [Microbacterium resistens]MDR6866546.1 diacylglycerol kinase family enzyme [Microbacterium resistens]